MPKISLLSEVIGGQEINTLKIIDLTLSAGPENGISIAEIRSRGKIDRVIEKLAPDATELVLNDELFETLRTAFEAFKVSARIPIIKTLVSELYPEDALS